ncbi:hypothetical protein GOP47_0028983 [Adiantum capillus-veneris]|nr:hypothetical protein GOP47_0028983 [Adiantum capillus-veneris]
MGLVTVPRSHEPSLAMIRREFWKSEGKEGGTEQSPSCPLYTLRLKVTSEGAGAVVLCGGLGQGAGFLEVGDSVASSMVWPCALAIRPYFWRGELPLPSPPCAPPKACSRRLRLLWWQKVVRVGVLMMGKESW